MKVYKRDYSVTNFTESLIEVADSNIVVKIGDHLVSLRETNNGDLDVHVNGGEGYLAFIPGSAPNGATIRILKNKWP